MAALPLSYCTADGRSQHLSLTFIFALHSSGKSKSEDFFFSVLICSCLSFFKPCFSNRQQGQQILQRRILHTELIFYCLQYYSADAQLKIDYVF